MNLLEHNRIKCLNRRWGGGGLTLRTVGKASLATTSYARVCEKVWMRFSMFCLFICVFVCVSTVGREAAQAGKEQQQLLFLLSLLLLERNKFCFAFFSFSFNFSPFSSRSTLHLYARRACVCLPVCVSVFERATYERDRERASLSAALPKLCARAVSACVSVCVWMGSLNSCATVS